MGLFAFLNHLLNFLAPALAMAGLVTLAARWFVKRKPVVLPFWTQLMINCLATTAGLMLGLWLLGRDGKMATYAAMILLCASSQWLMLRAWRV